MQYIIGFLSAFVVIYLMLQLQERYNILHQNIRIIIPRQSRNHELFNKYLQDTKGPEKPKRQSELHDKRTNIKVIIMDNQAYWIKDNVFYTADMSADGNVDKDTTRTVDTMSMSSVQLDKMMFIIDKLREEAFDDRGGSGY